jgi:hypothetical protein
VSQVGAARKLCKQLSRGIADLKVLGG